MKQVIAVIKPHLTEKVLEALKHAPLEAWGVHEVKGYGRQKNYLDEYGNNVYSSIETTIQDKIYEKFANWWPDGKGNAAIKLADRQVMKAEVVAWMPYECQSWPCLQGIDAADVRVEKWKRNKARSEFMLRYVRLMNRNGS